MALTMIDVTLILRHCLCIQLWYQLYQFCQFFGKLLSLSRNYDGSVLQFAASERHFWWKYSIGSFCRTISAFYYIALALTHLWLNYAKCFVNTRHHINRQNQQIVMTWISYHLLQRILTHLSEPKQGMIPHWRARDTDSKIIFHGLTCKYNCDVVKWTPINPHRLMHVTFIL